MKKNQVPIYRSPTHSPIRSPKTKSSNEIIREQPQLRYRCLCAKSFQYSSLPHTTRTNEIVIAPEEAIECPRDLPGIQAKIIKNWHPIEEAVDEILFQHSREVIERFVDAGKTVLSAHMSSDSFVHQRVHVTSEVGSIFSFEISLLTFIS